MEDKIKNILVSVMFLGIITFFMSVNILTKDKDISNSERRKLQQFPKITSQSLVDKTWAEDFNKYAMDQFVERDSFRKIKINLELGVKHNYNDRESYCLERSWIYHKIVKHIYNGLSSIYSYIGN